MRALLVAALLLTGCAQRHPSRQMNDMTADELRRELSATMIYKKEN